MSLGCQRKGNSDRNPDLQYKPYTKTNPRTSKSKAGRNRHHYRTNLRHAFTNHHCNATQTKSNAMQCGRMNYTYSWSRGPGTGAETGPGIPLAVLFAVLLFAGVSGPRGSGHREPPWWPVLAVDGTGSAAVVPGPLAVAAAPLAAADSAGGG